MQILQKSPSGAPVLSKFCFGVALGPILTRKWPQNGARKGWLDFSRGFKNTKISPDPPHTLPKTSKSAQSPLQSPFRVRF